MYVSLAQVQNLSTGIAYDINSSSFWSFMKLIRVGFPHFLVKLLTNIGGHLREKKKAVRYTISENSFKRSYSLHFAASPRPQTNSRIAAMKSNKQLENRKNAWKGQGEITSSVYYQTQLNSANQKGGLLRWNKNWPLPTHSAEPSLQSIGIHLAPQNGKNHEYAILILTAIKAS